MYFTNYTLTVNTKNLLDSSGNITESKRKELEAIVAHEFVHGVMNEALTCGMAGVANGIPNANNKFPLWFIEGMAQTASGGYANFNDFVNSGLGINSNTSVDDISRIVKGQYRLSNSESDGTGRSPYGVGYLACMYLGYLANGASDISEQSIRTGLSSMLKEMVGGKDLNTVIKEKTNNRYTGISDFQNKFGDTASSNFIKELTIRVGEGNGSLVAGGYNTDDILPDGEIPMTLFDLDITNDTVKNIYPSDVTMLNGGGASASGPEPIPGYKDGVSGSHSGGEVNPPVVDPPIVNPPIQPGNKIDLSNIGSIDGIDYDSSSNTLTVIKNGDYTLSGINSTGTKVVVKNGVQANIILDNAKINASSGEGIKLEENSNVTLKVTGDNTITAIGGRNASGIGCDMTIDGSSAVVKSIANGGADSFTGSIAINKGVFSDGQDWTSHDEVVIKSTITVSGTFTSENGSTVTIADGGKIGGTGSIKVKSGSTIKVENGGVIDAGSIIENSGNIYNRGKITTPCSPGIGNSIKNYINKVFNDLENQLRINIDQTLQEVLT